MTHGPELPPLPEPEQYHQAALHLDAVFRENGGISRYLAAYSLSESHRSTAMKNYMRKISRIGVTIEPLDRSLGESLSPDMPTQQAVINGGVTGLLFAKVVHGLDFPVIDGFNALSVDADTLQEEQDEHERKHMLASSLIDFGYRGAELVGEEARGVFEMWESQAVADVTKQPMFRASLGMITMSTYRLHQNMQSMMLQRAREEIAVTLANATNNNNAWDDELRSLLGDVSP